MEVTRKGKYGYLLVTGDDGKVFVVSDMHIGHANIIRFCNRPFKSIEEMNKMLIANWNSVVGENDIVINLGDFIWKGGDWNKIINQLNGKQIFIAGNHDRRTEMEKAERKTDKFLFIGDMVELRYNNSRFLLCHYPLASWSGSYHDLYHLYGHIHENESGVEQNIGGSPRKYNCCVELNDYTPQLLMDVKERIDTKIKKEKAKKEEDMDMSGFVESFRRIEQLNDMALLEIEPIVRNAMASGIQDMKYIDKLADQICNIAMFSKAGQDLYDEFLTYMELFNPRAAKQYRDWDDEFNEISNDRTQLTLEKYN